MAEKTKKNQFIVIGADVSIVIYAVENGELVGKERQTQPIRIKKSDWKNMEIIIKEKLKELCNKENIEELDFIVKQLATDIESVPKNNSKELKQSI